MFVPIVRWFASRDQIHQRLDTSKMRAAFDRSLSSSSRTDVLSGLSEETRFSHAVLHHEQDHLRRQISTTYGFLQRHIVGNILSLVEPILEPLQTFSKPFAFPVVTDFLQEKTAPAGKAAWKKVYGSCSEQEKSIWTAFAHLLILDFLEHERPRGNLAKKFTSVLELPSYLVDSEASCPWPIRPESLPHTLGNRCEISARHLFEHMAMLETTSWCSIMLGGIDIAIEKFTSETENEYSALFSAWRSRHPNTDCLTTQVRENDNITDCYAAFPVEHYALVDLALMVPFTPNGLDSRRNWNWDDISPGRRYLRGVEALRRYGKYTAIDAQDRKTAFKEAQDWLCRELDWPEPTELIESWRIAFDLGVPATFKELEGDPTPSMVQKYLEMKNADEFSFAINNVDWGLVKHDRFVAWLTHEPTGLTACPLSNEESGHFAFNLLLIFRAANAVLFVGTPELAAFAPRHREHAFQLLDSALLGRPNSDSSYIAELSSVFGRNQDTPEQFP